MANATSLANRIEAIFDEEEPEQSWLDNRVGRFTHLQLYFYLVQQPFLVDISPVKMINVIFDEEEPEQSWLDNRVGHFVSIAIDDFNCLFIKLPSKATFKFEIFSSNVHLTTRQWVGLFCGHVKKKDLT